MEWSYTRASRHDAFRDRLIADIAIPLHRELLMVEVKVKQQLCPTAAAAAASLVLVRLHNTGTDFCAHIRRVLVPRCVVPRGNDSLRCGSGVDALHPRRPHLRCRGSSQAATLSAQPSMWPPPLSLPGSRRCSQWRPTLTCCPCLLSCLRRSSWAWQSSGHVAEGICRSAQTLRQQEHADPNLPVASQGSRQQLLCVCELGAVAVEDVGCAGGQLMPLSRS